MDEVSLLTWEFIFFLVLVILQQRIDEHLIASSLNFLFMCIQAVITMDANLDWVSYSTMILIVSLALFVQLISKNKLKVGKRKR